MRKLNNVDIPQNKLIKKNKGITIIAIVVILAILLILALQNVQQAVTNQKQTYTITTKDGYEATIETDSNDNITLKEVLTPTQAKAKQAASTQNPNLLTGTITVSTPNWNANTHTATVTLSNTKGLKMQWQKNNISGMWQTGTTVTGLNHGDTVFTRLIDGEGNAADEASVSILDSIAPELATITNLPTTTTTRATITANVTHADNQSKIDITKCKWLFNTTSTNINVNNTDWNTAHTFSTSTNQITITVPTEPGNYYLHVLSVDMAGNKREKTSSKVEVKQLATGITVSPTSATLIMGNTLTITPTVTPNNTSNKTVTWTSSNNNIATVSTSGVVRPKATGTVTITAKTTDGTNKTATCSVEVKQLATGITVNPTSAPLELGSTLTITATVTPITTSNKTVTWTSSDTTVATVDSNGVVTPIKNGEVTITAKTMDGTNKTAKCSIEVDPIAKIGQTYYAKLFRAIQKVPEDNTLTTVEIIKDITPTTYETISEKQTIEFKLNNHTISRSSGHIFVNGGTIYILDGTISTTSTNYSAINNYGITEISGNANIIGGVSNHGILNVRGGTISSNDGYMSHAITNNEEGRVTITGGTLNAVGSGYTIYNRGGTINITGGTINGRKYGC